MRIKDIANEARVSTATVSHVINNTKNISDKTRQKVLAVIKKFNYSPSASARSLAMGSSKIIALLISDITNPFFPELVKSIETEVIEKGYYLILFNTNYDAELAAEQVRSLIQMKVAGVVLMTSELEPRLIDELYRNKVKVVFNGLGIVNEYMSNINLDYAGGIEEAVGHLISLGHTSIAHIAGPLSLGSGEIRRKAFINALKKYLPELPEPLIVEGDFRFNGGRAAASHLLDLKIPPTAVVAANDMMALGAMQEFKSAGLKIPQDISIIGFDDIDFTNLSEPALTTVCSPRLEIGRRAIEALLTTIEDQDRTGVEVHIPTYLIKRKSTAPPRQHKLLVIHG